MECMKFSNQEGLGFSEGGSQKRCKKGRGTVEGMIGGWIWGCFPPALFLVVTGATNGISKAYAHELAGRGLNIVLISRDLSKLEHEAKAIERLHGKSTRVIQVDFTGGLEIYEAIAAGLKDLEIGVLINSVGKQYAPGLRKLLDCEDFANPTASLKSSPEVLTHSPILTLTSPQRQVWSVHHCCSRALIQIQPWNAHFTSNPFLELFSTKILPQNLKFTLGTLTPTRNFVLKAGSVPQPSPLNPTQWKLPFTPISAPDP
ncbi:putative steroid dehydrogenase 1 isoform X1 [Orcinus orca]|uniref:putative steroid dehydrogenase 1 isoform X1 n=1 Tax=Orcinus orca TaxID=9733 RepID=UPI002113702B|nr:putative steroid dehydrogenase 1 isoform X1 [Orcinus orca]